MVISFIIIIISFNCFSCEGKGMEEGILSQQIGIKSWEIESKIKFLWKVIMEIYNNTL